MLKTIYQELLLLVVAFVMFALPIHAQNIANFTIAPTQVVGGNSATATITLDVPAPPSGFLVYLASLDSSVADTPPAVLIGSGNQSITFPITTHTVLSERSANIWAYINGNPKTAVIRPIFVVPAGFTGTTMAVIVEPSSITSGAIGHGTVYLNKVAPASGARVKLQSFNTKRVKVPVSVLVPAGVTFIPFDITTTPYCDDNVVGIAATYKTITSYDYLYLSTINLPQPTGLTATPDSNSVVLKWNRDPYAHSYLVKITMGGETATREEIVTCDQTVAIVRFDDVDAVRGETTEYSVVAVNAYGKSQPSVGVPVTPSLRAPDAPLNLVGAGGNQSASLVWSSIDEAVTYKVYRRLATKTAWTFVSETYNTKFVDSTPLNGVSYAYAVSGVNKTKEGKKSLPAFVTPMAPVQNAQTITTRARTFLQDIGQPATMINPDTGAVVNADAIVTYPATPRLLPAQIHYANRWKVVFPNAEMEITDDTGAIVYFRRIGPDTSGTLLGQENALLRADTIQLAAGLTSAHTNWSIKQVQYSFDDSSFWQLYCRPKVGGLIVREDHININMSLDGTVSQLMALEHYPTDNVITPTTTISEDDAKQIAKSVLDGQTITDVVYNSAMQVVVRSNSTYADPSTPPAPSVVRVAWDLLFVRHREIGTDTVLGDDAFEVWIDAVTGNLLGGMTLYSASSSNDKINKKKSSRDVKGKSVVKTITKTNLKNKKRYKPKITKIISHVKSKEKAK
jgi:hypothetical protein